MIALRKHSLSTVLAVASLLTLSACGDDHVPVDGHDHDAHVHEDAGSDASYPDTPCDPKLPPLMVGTEQLGNQTMRVKGKVVSSDPLPLLKGRADWVVDFTTADGGVPLTDLEFIDVYTYMPVHGHQGNFKPKAKPLEQPGRYEFDGFNFTMRGPWQVRFELTSPKAGGDDYLIFDVCVEEE
ncbi:MAG: FixH family protein [Myxococcales bacterium]